MRCSVGDSPKLSRNCFSFLEGNIMSFSKGNWIGRRNKKSFSKIKFSGSNVSGCTPQWGTEDLLEKQKQNKTKVSPSLTLGSGIIVTPPNKNERLEFMLSMWLQISSSPLYFALVVVMSRKVGRRVYMTWRAELVELQKDARAWNQGKRICST